MVNSPFVKRSLAVSVLIVLRVRAALLKDENGYSVKDKLDRLIVEEVVIELKHDYPTSEDMIVPT